MPNSVQLTLRANHSLPRASFYLCRCVRDMQLPTVVYPCAFVILQFAITPCQTADTHTDTPNEWTGVLWQCSLHFPSSSFVFACCAVCGCCVYQREENSNYLRLFSRAHLINNQAVIIPYTERSGIWHLRGGSNYWNLNITRGTRHKESMFLFCRAVWEIKHRDKTKTGNKNTAWNRRLHTLKIFVVRF